MKQGELCSEFVDPHSLAVSIRDRWMVSTHVETKHAPKVDHRYVFETVVPILHAPFSCWDVHWTFGTLFFGLGFPGPSARSHYFPHLPDPLGKRTDSFSGWSVST